jgi:hypothetical protein
VNNKIISARNYSVKNNNQNNHTKCYMKKSVTIELDKIRNLRYGLNALVKVEELTGKTITKLDLENISMKDLRTILFAVLYHEDKNLTPEKVGELIDDYSDIGTIAGKLGEAFTIAFGGNEKNAQNPQPKKKTGD